MGLGGASSNQGPLAHGHLAYANSTRVRILGQVDGGMPVTTKSVQNARPPKIRPLIEDILVAHGAPLKSSQIHALVQQKLGKELKPSTVKSALSDLAAMSNSPVHRISWGTYWVLGSKHGVKLLAAGSVSEQDLDSGNTEPDDGSHD